MAEQSQFWTTSGTGDGPSGGYTMADWLDIFTKIFVPPSYNTAYNGAVVPGNGGDLAVSGVASPVSVAAGAAFVGGYFYENTTALTLAITTPTVGTTGGHIILRASTAAQTVRLVAVRNTDGVAAIPALVNTPGTTVEIRLASFTITTGGVIALTDTRAFSIHGGLPPNDSVDDTKAGPRVPQFYRRQGGHATDYGFPGLTNYTPGAVRMQAGNFTIVVNADGTRTITFPVAFSAVPLVLLTLSTNPAGEQLVMLALSANSATSFTAYLKFVNNLGGAAIGVNWLAIGPE